MKTLNEISFAIILFVIFTGCKKNNDTENDFGYSYEKRFVFINKDKVDFFHANNDYYPDSLLIYDHQIDDTVPCSKFTNSTHRLIKFFYRETGDFTQFRLAEEPSADREFPLQFTLIYNNGDQDTLTVIEDGLLFNQKLTPAAGNNFPLTIQDNFLITKN